jgi:hypothetical protein
MSAVVSLVQNAGVSYSGYSQEVAKNIFYFLSQSDATAGKTTYPIILPVSGTSYSYELWVRARVDLAPLTNVYNFKAWYVSGMPATGFKITVNSDEVSTYSTPTNLISSQGTRIDFTTKNSEIDSIDLTGTLTSVGQYTSYLCFQLEVSSDGDTGENAVEWILQYDEI